MTQTGRDLNDGAKFYRLSDLKEEWLNPKFSRRIIAGRSEMVGYIVLLKGSVVPSHKHFSEQISIILKGALKFTINGEDIVVKDREFW